MTGPGTDTLCARLRADGDEVTVFHANGFGGAAFTRWAQIGAFKAVVDYTPHALPRNYIAGAHADMPERFTATGHLPRVVLPGGVNFIGMGEAALLPDAYKSRPHYAHSPLFTHVQCSEAEMVICADVLGTALQQAEAPVRVLIPMGGFRHEDSPGGAIEDKALREIAADILEREAGAYRARRLPYHINAPEVAQAAVDALYATMSHRIEHA